MRTRNKLSNISNKYEAYTKHSLDVVKKRLLLSTSQKVTANNVMKCPPRSTSCECLEVLALFFSFQFQLRRPNKIKLQGDIEIATKEKCKEC